MGVIVPAVLVPSRTRLEETLQKLVGLVDLVQVDVVDGEFIGPPTWPYADGAAEVSKIGRDHSMLPFGEHFRFEMDLMVRAPERTVGQWIATGATRILVHVESTEHLSELVADMQTTYGHEKGFAQRFLALGAALNIDTDTSVLDPYIEHIDYVQFMGIAVIGKQGQPFDPRVIPKIKAFRKQHPDTQVQVDGGVSLETAPELLSAGVHRLCVGSALVKQEDIPGTLAKFNALVERYGIYTT